MTTTLTKAQSIPEETEEILVVVGISYLAGEGVKAQIKEVVTTTLTSHSLVG